MLHQQTVSPETLGILKRLMAEACLSDHYLVGGTALALQCGHRISVDLDLFSHLSFSGHEIIEELQTATFPLVVRQVRDKGAHFLVQDVKVDLLYYPYPLLYPIIEEEGIRMADRRDIAAMKLDTISRRSTKKDFFDLHRLLQEFSLKEMLGFHARKFQQDTLFFIVRSLTFFQDADSDPDPVMLQNLTWAEVKKGISDAVGRI